MILELYTPSNVHFICYLCSCLQIKLNSFSHIYHIQKLFLNKNIPKMFSIFRVYYADVKYNQTDESCFFLLLRLFFLPEKSLVKKLSYLVCAKDHTTYVTVSTKNLFFPFHYIIVHYLVGPKG